MHGSPQQILNRLDADLRKRMMNNIERRLGINDFKKLTPQESDYVKREMEIYLYIEGEDSFGPTNYYQHLKD